ncbi:MAG: L,D-transpeptidase [Verrucomicrobia bacterium]|nr:L,D-transpeptidase [Verrucomicrobiota bacterium]MBV9642138.1 L,D-transpeptidase [Verrucomicrobiota bacterium]
MALALLFSSCSTKDTDHRILVSVADQSLELYQQERLLARYPISTSRFGLGDQPGSRGTPLGRLEVVKKIGAGARIGAVFKSRRETGEVLRPNTPGRDPIVTRIIWLKGLEPQNRHAFARCIYIHGTPEERNLGHPASFGCVRMKSADVLRVFNAIGVGATVDIIPGSLPDSTPPPAPPANLQIGKGLIVGPPAPVTQAVAVPFQTSRI